MKLEKQVNKTDHILQMARV